MILCFGTQSLTTTCFKVFQANKLTIPKSELMSNQHLSIQLFSHTPSPLSSFLSSSPNLTPHFLTFPTKRKAVLSMADSGLWRMAKFPHCHINMDLQPWHCRVVLHKLPMVACTKCATPFCHGATMAAN